MATKFPPCGCFMHRVFLGLVAPYNENCPEICGTDRDIIGISDSFTVDGWYLQADASNLVYMESDVITQTVECTSGLADYGHNEGVNGGYEAPHIFSVNKWEPMMEVLHENPSGFDYNFNVWVLNNPTVLDLTGASFAVQYSTDSGVTWVTGATSDQFEGPTTVSFNTGTNIFIYRTILTLADGCQFYNPAPDTGSPSYCIDYVTIDVSTDPLFELLGSINAITPLDAPATYQPLVMATLADPYQTVVGAYGGFGFDETGGLSIPFYMQVLRPSTEATTVSIADIIDSSSNPVDTTPDGTNCEAKTYYGEFTVTDFNALYIDGLKINGGTVSFPEVQTPNLNDQTEFLSRMQERGLRDPAMTVDFHGVDDSKFSITLTTVMPVEKALFDEVGVGQIIVDLIEI